jgi:hypothetical protein
MNRFANSPNQLIVIVISLLVAVVPGHGEVTFSAPVSYRVGTNPGNIITGDFNGDGIPDLAVANAGDASVGDLGSVSLLLGKGDGTFRPAMNTSAGPLPGIILGGDFNGDGKLDLFVQGQPSNNATLVPWSLLFGEGDGTFAAPAQIALTNYSPSIVAGDFNDDKKLDLVFIDQDSNDLEEALGNGDGTFQSAQTLGSSGGANLLIAADFSGDGKLDLEVSGVAVLLGKGDGTFQPPISHDFKASLAVDLNRDGKKDLIDLAVVRHAIGFETTTNYSLEVHLSNGNGSFQGTVIATGQTHRALFTPITGTSIDTFTAGDFDGDGKTDIVFTSTDRKTAISSVQFLAGNGDGTFVTDPGTIAGSFLAGETSDLNGDKLADLGAAPLTSSAIGVVLNTTQGFWLATPDSIGPLRAGASATESVAVNPQNGFSNEVSLSCVASHPSIHCSVSPSSVAPDASSTLTVATTGPSATSLPPGDPFHVAWLYALCVPFGTILFGRRGFGFKRIAGGNVVWMALGCVLFVGVMFQTACGGGGKKPDGPHPTPPGTYTITVTGTSGITRHSMKVTLAVQ